jgi:hypothetical protein
MTLADSSSRKVDVIGPHGLTHLIATMRKYVLRYVIHCAVLIVPLSLPQGLLHCHAY